MISAFRAASKVDLPLPLPPRTCKQPCFFARTSRIASSTDATFAILMAIQWSVRRRVADIYLENQRQNNRLIAHGYTAWDNVFSGNRYNWRLWIDGFKGKLRDCFRAQVKAIMAREGLSALGGIIGLAIVFSTMTYGAIANAGGPRGADRARDDAAAADRDDQQCSGVGRRQPGVDLDSLIPFDSGSSYI